MAGGHGEKVGASSKSEEKGTAGDPETRGIDGTKQEGEPSFGYIYLPKPKVSKVSGGKTRRKKMEVKRQQVNKKQKIS